MASAFLLSSNTASAATSVFTVRPRSSSKPSFNSFAAPRTHAQHIPAISAPQHNDRFIDGDTPFLTDVECDLDISFASNMSIGSAPSSPPIPSTDLPDGFPFLAPTQTLRAPSSPVPMDISPAPRRIASTMRVTPSARSSTKGVSGRNIVQELFRGFGHDSSSPDVRATQKLHSPEPEEFVEFNLEEEIAHAQQEELRRSGRAPSPEKAVLFSSSPPTSPSRPIRPGPGIGLGRPFERSATTGGQGTLFGSLGAQAQAVLPKRTLAPRRPALSTIVPEGTASASAIQRPGALQPTRRAFSACVTSSALVMGRPVGMDNLGSDDSQDFDGSPARAYATRKAAPALRRDLLPSRTGKVEPKGTAPNHSSPLARLGLPGFGDNEADGKVLPCYKVREDGLMRINCDTLDDLLAGHYNSQINSYTVIDCRFEYEYEGGHIPGAINLNTTQAVEDYLLGEGKPDPSRSGDGTKKDVLVFHCEFSVKRAPTFAKHLRSRDRTLNSHSYPKVHYPEVYVMAGGFSQYFKEKPSQVDPPYSYVRMDDPVHLRARHNDLNNFRRWERTKS
ncbi:cell division cycle- protein, partial [Ceratobasidium sp. 395]